MMKPSRSYISRTSNDLGDQLENMILAACQHYRLKGVAEIDKTPEPFRVMKINPNGTFTVRATGKAQPDFQGTLCDGRSIVFEAKATRSKNGKLGQLQQSRITKNQWDRLEHHWQLGAIAGVVCQIDKTFAFVPWSIWRDMKEYIGFKHLKEIDLKPYEVFTPGYVDFLTKKEGDLGWAKVKHQ